MKPVEFPQQTLIIAKDQPEYLPLPAFVSQSKEGEVVTCWELSDEDIETIIRTRKMWLCQWTFHQKLQPQRMTVDSPFEEKKEPKETLTFTTISKGWDNFDFFFTRFKERFPGKTDEELNEIFNNAFTEKLESLKSDVDKPIK